MTAEVVRKWISPKEPNQTVQLPDPILERRSGEAPSVISLQRKGSLCSVGRTFFDVVGLIKLFQMMTRVRGCTRRLDLRLRGSTESYAAGTLP